MVKMIVRQSNDNEIESESDSDEGVYVCHDPEFSDFDKDRSQNCFGVGQTWAIFANADCMPRFYARVRKLLSPGFKLEITWLEACPLTEDENDWAYGDLPVSCGEFELGDTEEVVDQRMFSHQIICTTGKRKDTYMVYPQKGETWALYKDWDISWGCEPERHQPPYGYDFVEILSGFREEVGVEVGHLLKVEGFISVFQQAGGDMVSAFRITPGDMLRFSHRVPSCRLTGMEGRGVPTGSFELDPSSLPGNLCKADAQKELELDRVIDSYSSSRNDNVKLPMAPVEICAPNKSEVDHESPIVVCGLAAIPPNVDYKKYMQEYAGRRFGDEIVNNIQPHGPTAPVNVKQKISSSTECETTEYRDFSELKKAPMDVSMGSDELMTNKVVDNENSDKVMNPSRDENEAQTSNSSSHSDKPVHVHMNVESTRMSQKRKDAQEELRGSKKPRSAEDVQMHKISLTDRDRDKVTVDYGNVSNQELDLKEAELSTLEERIKTCTMELERTQVALQERQGDLLAKEGSLQSIEELIEKTNLQLENRESKYKLIRLSIIQCSGELRSKQSQLEYLERSIRDSIAKERALYYVKDEVRESCRALELKERELSDIQKTIGVKNKVLDVKAKLLKEIKSKIALNSEQLKAMEEHRTEVQNSLTELQQKLIHYQEFAKDQPLDAGNDGDLLLRLDEHLRKHDLLQSEVSSAMLQLPDPAKWVLEVMHGFYPPLSEDRERDYDLSVTRRRCITLLEHLVKMRPWITADVRGEAMKLAREWKTRMRKKRATSLEVLALLQLISAFELVTDIGADEVRQLVSSCLPSKGNGSETWKSLGIMDDIADCRFAEVNPDELLQATS
ncbi:Truncated FRIGIDA-like protein 1 [Linum perenne]